ncbi:MAG: threonine--tRNA ligase [Candidatus Pacebacteria bacterium]|nr:threonine--tRNA ligase [Candidatus Paceibacterota bacterium]
MTKTNENIHNIRHSLAHLLAIAVLEKDPGAKLAIGPVIDNGFYYDFEFSKGYVPSAEDLKGFQKAMKKMTNKDTKFVGSEISVSDAKKMFKSQPYKIELIEELEKKGEKITIYKTGDFTDLCMGGHVESTKEIDPDCFVITHTAGAYWRGDEKNTMLTRVYGLAFENGAELDAYQKQQEEAKKRDHRKIGKELGLFVFSDLVGPGLPLWTPKGTMIRELLNDYVWELRRAKGYQKVTIPHITKKELYETSGHWKKFSEELFKINTREGHLFAMKPMNCPHHTQIFDSAQRSYRDMPQRYCETTMVYRDEQSGELSGLSRVLSITQDDAHVFCRENQIEQEVFAIWDIIDTFYKAFGFELKIRFSRHDPANFAEKHTGTKEVWDKAEGAMRALIEKRGITDYIDGKGEAAMYGPKIDFITKDSLGRTLQVATIQLDFNQPASFKLSCINEKSEKEQVVMIHCAIMGSIERFTSTMIEHTGGNFPLWLSPVQVKILPVTEKHIEYADKVKKELESVGMRIEVDASNDSLGKRIRNAKVEKTPYILVLGDKELDATAVTAERRDGGHIDAMPLKEFVSKTKKEVDSKEIW